VNRTAKISSLLLVSLFAIFILLPSSTRCSSVTLEDIASEFIQNALPIDISTYEMALTPHDNEYFPTVECTLKSEQSALRVNCYFQNNTLKGCNLYAKNGSIKYDKHYANITDVAIGFLEKYQNYIQRDSTELINLLRNVDMKNNSTTIAGNIKLIVTVKDTMGAEYTNLDWRLTFEGTDYPIMSVSFENEAFHGFTDSRALYTIGDTTVNTSKEQAINAAMEYLKTYSYAAGGYQISGFKVNESRTEAKLTCGVRNSSVLYPIWVVILFLNHTYPGSINAFSISVWAGSGEINNIGFHTEPRSPPKYYDPNLDPDRDLYDWNLPDTDNSIALPEQNSPNPPLNTYLIMAAVALIISPIAIAAFIKMRKK